MTALSETIEVGIVTHNIDTMCHFYGNTLGLAFEGKLDFPGGTMHRYRLGTAVIKLVNYGDETPEQCVPGGGHAACGYRYISFGVADLNSVIAQLKAANVGIAVDVTRFAENIGFAFVCDPDGNWIELFGGC